MSEAELKVIEVPAAVVKVEDKADKAWSVIYLWIL